MQPHRAEYTLRLGAAANAARIGTALQDLTFDCDAWRLERVVKGEIALTTSLKMNVSSELDSEEPRFGDAFRYRTLQIQNGTKRRTHGKVQRAGDDLRAEIVSPTGLTQLVLPSPTLMPVASINHLIGRLRDGATAFPAFAFDAEGIGDAFLIDVTQVDPGALRSPRPADKPVTVPGKSWPVLMSFAHSHERQEKPLFTISARIFESGVLDRLTVETSMATVTADLQALHMHQPPACTQP